MGGSQSVPGVSADWGTDGFHVLQTQHGSPAFHAGIDPYFDFIVAINGTRLDEDSGTLQSVLSENLNKPVQLCIYSSKYKRLRYVEVTPSLDWGGPGCLGISIRFCSFAQASEIVWHVTEVLPGSPADMAGLISESDYIIGSENTLYNKEDLLTLIEVNDRQPIRLFCYNADTDLTREVVLTPDSDWPGEGSLGCQLCTGYLHQIPSPDLRTDPSLRASQLKRQGLSPPRDSNSPVTRFQSVFAGETTGLTKGMPEAEPAGNAWVERCSDEQSNHLSAHQQDVASTPIQAEAMLARQAMTFSYLDFAQTSGTQHPVREENFGQPGIPRAQSPSLAGPSFTAPSPMQPTVSGERKLVSQNWTASLLDTMAPLVPPSSHSATHLAPPPFPGNATMQPVQQLAGHQVEPDMSWMLASYPQNIPPGGKMT